MSESDIHFLESESRKNPSEGGNGGNGGGGSDITQRLSAVEQGLGTVEKRLGAVEEKVGAVEQRLGTVEKNIAVLDERTQYLATKDDVSQLKVWVLGGVLGGMAAGIPITISALKLLS